MNGPRIAGWTILYMLNLIVPVLFGIMVCDKGGLAGMLVGIVIFYVAATFLVIRFHRMGTAAIIGSGVVALSQFWAIAQLYSGLLALSVWGFVSGTKGTNDLGGGNPILAELGGCAVTIMTGQPLFALAIIIGLPFAAMLRSDASPTDDPWSDHGD
jgi:hypothetical protein